MLDLLDDNYFMQQAIQCALRANELAEVPIGAVIRYQDKIIGRGWNQVETLKDATAHAEMLALSSAQQAIGDWRLNECQLYVTKEPCCMCAGAIMHCRLQRVIYGCGDVKTGATGGWINLLDSAPPLNHKCLVTAGILADECKNILQQFFRRARQKNYQK